MKSITRKPHLLLLGHHPAFNKFLPFGQYRISLIAHTTLVELLEDTRTLFTDIRALDVPHNMNLDEYHDAMEQIIAFADDLIRHHGLPDGIVGLFEHVTLPAAKLRQRYHLPGTMPEVALRFRDKVLMKSVLSQHGFRVPEYHRITDTPDWQQNVTNALYGLTPLILKPISQAASQGVELHQSLDSLLQSVSSKSHRSLWQAEEYITGRLLHFDGLLRDGDLQFISVSEYQYPCYETVHEGKPLISSTIDDKALFSRVETFGQEILETLGLRDGVFHGEAFLTPNDELVFLEIGNRFGGAGVTLMLKQIFGFDIVEEALRVDLGLEQQYQGPVSAIDTGVVGTYVYAALPTMDPCTVVGLAGLEDLPRSIIHSEIPNIADQLNVHVGPFPTSGKFFLKNAIYADAVKDAQNIAELYKLQVISHA